MCPLLPLAPPSYLCDLCCPGSVLAVHRMLCSAVRGELLVPRTHLATMQRRAFSVGPSTWNDLPVELRFLLIQNFTSSLSPSFLAVTGLGTPLSCSVLKKHYISLQNE